MSCFNGSRLVWSWRPFETSCGRSSCDPRGDGTGVCGSGMSALSDGCFEGRAWCVLGAAGLVTTVEEEDRTSSDDGLGGALLGMPA